MQHQFDHIPEESVDNLACFKCGQNKGVFMWLQCGHAYCIVCACFLYSKCRKQYINESAIRCTICSRVVLLSAENVQTIKDNIKLEIMPNIESDGLTNGNKLTTIKDNQATRYTGPVNRKFKSEEHSFENPTPSTAKYFFSKCESPKSRDKKQAASVPNLRRFCGLHALEAVHYLCLTCNAQPLCLKCIPDPHKKHHGHDIQELKKAITTLTEQLSISRLEVKYKIDQTEMFQKRIHDRQSIVEERARNILAEIKQSFADLYIKLKQKQNEIAKECSDHFKEALASLDEETSRISEYACLLKGHVERITAVKNEPDDFEFLQKYFALRGEESAMYVNSHRESIDKFAMPCSQIFKDIGEVVQKVKSIRVKFKSSNISRMGAGSAEFENCGSESKLNKQNPAKRVKTNIASLNSSRQRKRKCTKTEEDEKRMKNERRISRGDKDKKNSTRVPNYIVDFINKKSAKLGTNGHSYLHEASIPENLTKISKLSKTISPDDIVNKKKQHIAAIKTRIQSKKRKR